MRFEDEQYVRVYRRDTTTWLMMNWQGRCILPLILRKLDRAGLLDLEGDGYDALAAHIQVPVEVVEEGIKSILRRGTLVLREDGLLMAPRFIEAQEAKQSDKARQKASRDRARDLAGAVDRGVKAAISAPPEVDDDASASVTHRDGTITHRDSSITPRDATVTRGHTASQPVTLNSAEPSCAQQITPYPQGGPTVVPMPEARSTTSRTRAGTPKTSWPESFTVSSAIDAMCRAEGLPNPHDVIRDFESAARANGYRYADWEAAFRKWMRSAITRRDYPAWDPPAAPEPQEAHGKAAPPPPGLVEKLAAWNKPRALTPIEQALAAPPPAQQTPVLWGPAAERVRAGGDR